MIYNYICKMCFKALAFLYMLPLTLIKIIYVSCWSSDHFRKLAIIDHKYKIPNPQLSHKKALKRIGIISRLHRTKV